MAKKAQDKLGMMVSAGVLLCILGAVLIGNMNTFFGIYMPKEMVYAITLPLSWALVALAVWLHLQRRKPIAQKIYRGLLTYFAFALFIIGWRFVAGDPTSFGYSNDGFTVTGGFMMLGCGLISGYLLVGHMKLKGKK